MIETNTTEIKKKKVGRPSKYNPKYCNAIVKFFDVKPYEIKDQVRLTKDGKEIIVSVPVPSDLPLFCKFCADNDLDEKTLLNWTETIPEFFCAYKKAKQLQEHILVTNGLKGYYNTAFACFTAKNIMGWRNETEVNLNSKSESTININTYGIKPDDYDALAENILKRRNSVSVS